MKTKTAQSICPQEINLLVLLALPLITLGNLSNYLTQVAFSDSDQEPTLQWQSENGFSLRLSATNDPKRSQGKFTLKTKKVLLARSVLF